MQHSSRLGAHTLDLRQRPRRHSDQPVQVDLEVGDLLGQLEPAAGDRPQRELGRVGRGRRRGGGLEPRS
jgi:hypothetical protein